MYVGVDVGGTYTDAALLDGGRVLATAKVPTRKEELIGSILEAMDNVLENVDKSKLKKIIFSTTMITNLIAERKFDDVDLLLIPGPGLSHAYYKLKPNIHILSGAIDFRGRETVRLNEQEILSTISEIAGKGIRNVGVIGKFSPRNTSHEKYVASIISGKYPEWQIEVGSRIASQLNFPRRVETTYLTCATRAPYRYFINSVRQALEYRKISAEVFILKADGGTLPLEGSEELPVETIFSGPAASTLGVLALAPPGETAVVVDIGGTTTDLALILSGEPLLSSKGAKVMEQFTQVRALAVKSIAVGGDSALKKVGSKISISPNRLGPAFCMGGPAPTPTDALRTLGLSTIGEREKAVEAMAILGESLGMSAVEAARIVTGQVVDMITAEIDNMFLEWEQEPAYRVWEVLQKHKVRPDIIAGVGGGSEGFVEQIATKMGCAPFIPAHAAVANAIGAAVAMPTMQVSLRADTEQGYYIIKEEAYQEKIRGRSFNEQRALDLAKKSLIEWAARYGLEVKPEEIEVTHQEVFNMIRGWNTSGRLIDVTVQTPRGIAYKVGNGGY